MIDITIFYHRLTGCYFVVSSEIGILDSLLLLIDRLKQVDWKNFYYLHFYFIQSWILNEMKNEEWTQEMKLALGDLKNKLDSKHPINPNWSWKKTDEDLKLISYLFSGFLDIPESKRPPKELIESGLLEHEPNRFQENQSRLPNLERLEKITIGLSSEEGIPRNILEATKYLFGDPNLDERKVHLIKHHRETRVLFELIQVLGIVYNDRQFIKTFANSEESVTLLESLQQRINKRKQDEKAGKLKPQMFDVESDECEKILELLNSEMEDDESS